jgi:hypothetical protein
MKKLKEISDVKLKSLETYISIAGYQFFKILTDNYKLPEWFIHKHRKSLSWDGVLMYQECSEKFINEHIDDIDQDSAWTSLIRFQTVSLDFLKKHHSRIDWDDVTIWHHLDKEIISEFYNKLSITDINIRNLIEEFITPEELEAIDIMHQITK